MPGAASEKIKKELKKTEKIKIFSAGSMKQAVNKAAKQAKKGDIVLFSPGAASFNLFKNEFDRGEHFIEAVKKLK